MILLWVLNCGSRHSVSISSGHRTACKVYHLWTEAHGGLDNLFSDLSNCGGLCYLERRMPVIDVDENLQRLILCFIDFADSKGYFSYKQFRKPLKLGACPVDLPEPEPKTPSNVESVPWADELVTAAAAAPGG